MLNKYSDYEIINLDILNYAGNLENLKKIENNKNYSFIKGDICDFELVNEPEELHGILKHRFPFLTGKKKSITSF